MNLHFCWTVHPASKGNEQDDSDILWSSPCIVEIDWFHYVLGLTFASLLSPKRHRVVPRYKSIRLYQRTDQHVFIAATAAGRLALAQKWAPWPSKQQVWETKTGVFSLEKCRILNHAKLLNLRDLIFGQSTCFVWYFNIPHLHPPFLLNIWDFPGLRLRGPARALDLVPWPNVGEVRLICDRWYYSLKGVRTISYSI